MNKILEIFFRYILPRRDRYEFYLRDIKIIDERYPYYLGIPTELLMFKDKLKNDAIKYWRIWK